MNLKLWGENSMKKPTFNATTRKKRHLRAKTLFYGMTGMMPRQVLYAIIP